MIKRLAVGLVAAVLWAVPALGQLPGGSEIQINRTPVVGGTNGDCLTVSSGKVGQTANCGAAAGITVGTSPIASGTNGRVLYDNSGVVGELATTGSGSAVLATAPTFTTSITFPSVAWASVPAAGTAGKLVRVSNMGPNGGLMMDDGTRWRPVGGCFTYSTLNTPSSSISNSDTVVFTSTAFPANFLKVGDRLRLWYQQTRSGTTDVANLAVRLGTAGTTADAVILGGAAVSSIGSTNVTVAVVTSLIVKDATTLTQLGNTSGVNSGQGYSASSTSNSAGDVTISNITSNALILSMSINTAQNTTTTILRNAVVEYCASGN